MTEQYVYQEWPKWIVGPDGEGRSFDSPEDVPEGWGEALVEPEVEPALVQELEEATEEAPKKRGRPPKVVETETSTAVADEPEIEF